MEIDERIRLHVVIHSIPPSVEPGVYSAATRATLNEHQTMALLHMAARSSGQSNLCMCITIIMGTIGPHSMPAVAITFRFLGIYSNEIFRVFSLHVSLFRRHTVCAVLQFRITRWHSGTCPNVPYITGWLVVCRCQSDMGRKHIRPMAKCR